MNIGETVQVPAVEYVEIELDGDNYRRYSADHWVWQVGESGEYIGPNQTKVLETEYQRRVSQHHTYRVYANGLVVHEDDFSSLSKDSGDNFQIISIPEELIDHIREDGAWQCKKCHKRVNAISYTSLCNDCNVQGDESLQEATRTEKPITDVEQTTIQSLISESIDNAIANGYDVREIGSFDLTWDLIQKEPLLEDVFEEHDYAEVEKSVQFKLKQLEESGDCKQSTCDDCEGDPKGCLKETNHDQHPQFRDIGIRIDRYGSLVFKPELVE